MMGERKKKKVLVVEDSPMNKILMKDMLTMNDYDVLEADGGREAIKISEEENPDIILMDINLPEMDGIAVTKILKGSNRCKHIPVIAITASAMKGEDAKILSEGFDGYMSKPVEMKKLLKTIESYFKK